MADQEQYRQLSREELTKLAGEELPERAAVSLVNASVAAPVNAAVALSALSDNSAAVAAATQNADITQSSRGREETTWAPSLSSTASSAGKSSTSSQARS